MTRAADIAASPAQPSPGPISAPGVFDFMTPPPASGPVVLASPHSGSSYTEAFLAESRLGLDLLRRAEDCHVDALFLPAAHHLAAPLLRALFPRCFVDANREPYELDPNMFDDVLPDYVNTRSPRVINGLGTVARIVAHGHDIYRHKLRFAEIQQRLNHYYRPYHNALQTLLEHTRHQTGMVVLIDCHSMPSLHIGTRRRGVVGMPDFVLGDFFGSACAPAITLAAETALKLRGHSVVRNTPYAGGYITRHYGQPRHHRHVLQVEVNRALYMNEDTLERLPGHFERIADTLTVMADAIAKVLPSVAGQTGTDISALGTSPARVR
jgi:N-formylglutamate amidohydrolase